MTERPDSGVGVTLQLAHLIEVFACDIDGCLAAAEHAPYDLPALRRMAELNALSRLSADVPALTLVTGRPHAYVDAVTQVLGIDLAVSFENGAGLATRRPYRTWLSPGAVAGQRELEVFTALVAAEPRMVLQLGKVASLSVFPAVEGYELADLLSDVEDLLRRSGVALTLDPSTDCVNVLIPGVDKGTGFAWLLDELGVTPQAVAGIGDSVGDLAWLAACAVSVAPSNAVPEVKAAVDVVWPGQDVAAALAAYIALVEANRRL